MSSQKPRNDFIPKSTKDMSKEMLTETLQKKKECNTRAVKIVEQMCDESIGEGWFLHQLQFINQAHFDDIVAERVILNKCGYVLCTEKLEEVPKQQYRISMKYKQVYDLSERKNFCSNKCYQSAVFVKKQMLTSPLWFREHEVIPHFTLLKTKQPPDNNPIFEETSDNICDTMEKEINIECETEVAKLDEIHQSTLSKDKPLPQDRGGTLEKDSNTTCDNIEKQPMNEHKTLKTLNNENKLLHSESSISSVHIGSHNSAECNPKASEGSSSHGTKLKHLKQTEAKSQQSLASHYVKKVEKCINEWFTMDTLLYLYGEDKVKEMFEDKWDRIKSILSSKPIIPHANRRMDKLAQLFDVCTGNLEPTSQEKVLKPLPDYSILKHDAKDLDIKVKAFYGGQLEIQTTNEDITVEKDIAKDDEDLMLPCLDSSSQNTIRQRIVLDALNKVLPELQQTLLAEGTIERTEVRDFISHCTLQADNVTFRQGEWFLLGLILMKMLCIRNHRLKSCLEAEKSRKHVTLLLMSYELQPCYLDILISNLTSSDALITKLEQ